MTTTINASTSAGLVQTADTSGILQLQTANTAALTIDGSQNVGIGTSSPSYRLDLFGANCTLQVRDIGQTNGLILKQNNSDGGNLVYATNNNYLALGTNNTERMRIDSSGNLLVGTTSTSPNPGVALNNTGSIAIGNNAGASGYTFQYFLRNAGIIGSITQNGTTGVLYNLTSDYRLKNDQQPLTGAKEFVMALQPKKWQWWDGSGEGVGFIAHEFMEVAKYSGSGEKDAVDENGNPVYQSIQPSSSEVMANIVSLLQEQQALIISMREEIDALKLKVGA